MNKDIKSIFIRHKPKPILSRKPMEYYLNTITNSNYDDTVTRVMESLKSEGFSVITEIDMQAKLKDKLGVNYKKYKIFGACNPEIAYQALQAEEKIGVMLPCNVIIIDRQDGTTEVACVNPESTMVTVQNPVLKLISQEVTNKLRSVINKVGIVHSH